MSSTYFESGIIWPLWTNVDIKSGAQWFQINSTYFQGHLDIFFGDKLQEGECVHS